jgi:hypothetical protein
MNGDLVTRRFDSACTAVFGERADSGPALAGLAPVLGRSLARELVARMLDDWLDACRKSSGSATVLVGADAADAARLRASHPGCAGYEVESGADFATRAAAFARRALERAPRESLVCVAAESACFAPEALDRAHAELAAGAELVLAPAAHARVALAGFGPGAKPLLARWPRGEVTRAGECASAGDFERVRALAGELGLAHVELEPVACIDTPDELERLCLEIERRLARSEPVPRAVANTLEGWGLLPRA